MKTRWVATGARRASPVPLILILLAAVVAGAGAARAEGRITFSKMTVQGCKAMGKCIWKMTCQVGPNGQVVQSMRGVSRDVQKMDKSFDVQSFPVNVQCRTDIDDGWFTTSWKEVGRAEVSIPGGGDWKLEMANKEKGGVVAQLTVDSLDVGAPAAAPAAAKAPAKAAAKPSAKPAAAKAPRQFVAVYQERPEGAAVLVGMPWAQFKARADQLESGGVRIVSLDSYVDGGRRLWNGIFRSATEKQELAIGVRPEDFNNKYKDMVVNKHMRLVDVIVYDEGDKRFLAGVFREGYDNPELWLGQDQKQFQGKVTELGGRNLRLVRMDVYKATGNKLNYAGTFREGTGSYGLWTGLDRDAFLAKWKKASDSGTQVNEVKTYVEGKKRLYDGVIGGGGLKTAIVLDLDQPAFVAQWKEQFKKGMRLVGFDTYQD
jgi:hypothetical protein